ncbi:MAG: DnaD domain protein [Oscillospiraceae bacterium]|nr:DnaD domain protein [Oscillospiraceae bacterium]MBQ6928434.1 DnaD domain protein [Oscillospiraceae bacterium]
MQGDRETLHVSPPEADQIISAHDGDVALLWLYRLRHPDGDLEDAARALCRTLREMEAALEKLRRMGLARGEIKPVQPAKPQPQKLPPADELPEYTAKDLAVRSREDPNFAALVTEAQRALGRTLSSSDLKKLFGLYDYLSLPVEVIMMLLNYCVSSRAGGNPPSMRQIEKEAYVWADREILTIEQADEYIAGSQRRRERLAQMARLVGITDRAPGTTEAKFLSEWIDMGFDDEMIALAYDKTLTNTGKHKLSYTNAILKNWHQEGIHTPQDARNRDSRRTEDRKGAAAEAPKDIEKLIAGLDKI